MEHGPRNLLISNFRIPKATEKRSLVEMKKSLTAGQTCPGNNVLPAFEETKVYITEIKPETPASSI